MQRTDEWDLLRLSAYESSNQYNGEHNIGSSFNDKNGIWRLNRTSIKIKLYIKHNFDCRLTKKWRYCKNTVLFFFYNWMQCQFNIIYPFREVYFQRMLQINDKAFWLWCHYSMKIAQRSINMVICDSTSWLNRDFNHLRTVLITKSETVGFCVPGRSKAWTLVGSAYLVNV